MAAGRPDTVDAYIAAQPEAVRARLERMRAAIRKAAPNAVEQISYAIPAFKIDGKVLVYFAGWKEHVALYPASATLLANLAGALTAYDVAKGTIRFPLTRPMSYALVARIVRLRVAEIAASATTKPKRTSAMRSRPAARRPARS